MRLLVEQLLVAMVGYCVVIGHSEEHLEQHPEHHCQLPVCKVHQKHYTSQTISKCNTFNFNLIPVLAIFNCYNSSSTVLLVIMYTCLKCQYHLQTQVTGCPLKNTWQSNSSKG